MTRDEIKTRLNNIAEHAVHIRGEKPFILSLDDGIALKEAVEILSAEPCEEETLYLEDVVNIMAKNAAEIPDKTYYDMLKEFSELAELPCDEILGGETKGNVRLLAKIVIDEEKLREIVDEKVKELKESIEPCEDAVSREAVENIFVDSCIFDILLALKDGKADVEDAIKKINLEFRDEVRELPTVQPKKRSGIG